MKVKLNAVVVHNGKEYGVGDIVEVDNASAKRLIDLRIAEEIKKKRNGSKNTDKQRF